MTGRTDGGASGWDPDGWDPDGWDAFARAHEWPHPHPFDVAAGIAAASAPIPAPGERPWRFPLQVAPVRHIDDAAILSGEL